MNENERLFAGHYPTGIVYADRKYEENGDYKFLAHLSYDTAELKWYITDEEKKSLKFYALVEEILQDHGVWLRKVGQEFNCSTTQKMIFGYSRKEPVWTEMSNNDIRHVWMDEESGEETYLSPDFYSDNGTPIGDTGMDMIYVRTEVLR